MAAAAATALPLAVTALPLADSDASALQLAAAQHAQLDLAPYAVAREQELKIGRVGHRLAVEPEGEATLESR